MVFFVYACVGERKRGKGKRMEAMLGGGNPFIIVQEVAAAGGGGLKMIGAAAS